MMSGAWIPLFALYVLLPVLLVSGLIRLRLFGLRCFDEYRRTRIELGKLAEEVSLIRQNLERRES